MFVGLSDNEGMAKGNKSRGTNAVLFNKSLLLLALMGIALRSEPAPCEDNTLVQFSRECRDVVKHMLPQYEKPFRNKLEFEEALERVAGKIGSLSALQQQSSDRLSLEEQRVLKDAIIECRGALAMAMTKEKS